MTLLSKYKHSVFVWAFFFLLFTSLSSLNAQTWEGADPGAWEDGGNWDTGSVPTGEVFVGSGEAQISSQVPSVTGFNLTGTGDVTLLSEGVLRANVGGDWVVGRFGGSGSLTVEDGALVEVVRFVRLTVGPGGSAGGRIKQTGGEVLVNDTFFVGDRNDGIGFYDMSGGHLRHQTDGAFRVGHLETGVGTLTISGEEAVMEDGELTSGTLVEATRGIEIGREGNGTLVQTGGTLNVTGGIMNLGTTPTGRGEVTVSGGTFQVGGTLRVNNGTGTFRVDGSGASQVVIGNNMEFGRSGTEVTLAIKLDADGSTLVEVGEEGDIRNVTLEAGVLEGFAGQVGDTFDLLTASNIRDDGMDLVNTSDGYVFSVETVGGGNGEILRLKLEEAPDPVVDLRLKTFDRTAENELRIGFASNLPLEGHEVQATDSLDEEVWEVQQDVQWDDLGDGRFRATFPMPLDEPRGFYRIGAQ